MSNSLESSPAKLIVEVRSRLKDHRSKNLAQVMAEQVLDQDQVTDNQRVKNRAQVMDNNPRVMNVPQVMANNPRVKNLTQIIVVRSGQQESLTNYCIRLQL
jgi:anti-sigma factor ChrR (cupin superfamily)